MWDLLVGLKAVLLALSKTIAASLVLFFSFLLPFYCRLSSPLTKCIGYNLPDPAMVKYTVFNGNTVVATASGTVGVPTTIRIRISYRYVTPLFLLKF